MDKKAKTKLSALPHDTDRTGSEDSKVKAATKNKLKKQKVVTPSPTPTRGGIYNDDDDEVCVNGLWDWDS